MQTSSTVYIALTPWRGLLIGVQNGLQSVSPSRALEGLTDWSSFCQRCVQGRGCHSLPPQHDLDTSHISHKYWSVPPVNIAVCATSLPGLEFPCAHASNLPLPTSFPSPTLLVTYPSVASQNVKEAEDDILLRTFLDFPPIT